MTEKPGSHMPFAGMHPNNQLKTSAAQLWDEAFTYGSFRDTIFKLHTQGHTQPAQMHVQCEMKGNAAQQFIPHKLKPTV